MFRALEGDASAVMFLVCLLRLRYQSCCHLPILSILLQFECVLSKALADLRGPSVVQMDIYKVSCNFCCSPSW